MRLTVSISQDFFGFAVAVLAVESTILNAPFCFTSTVLYQELKLFVLRNVFRVDTSLKIANKLHVSLTVTTELK